MNNLVPHSISIKVIHLLLWRIVYHVINVHFTNINMLT